MEQNVEDEQKTADVRDIELHLKFTNLLVDGSIPGNNPELDIGGI